MSDSRDEAFQEASKNNDSDEDFIFVKAGELHQLTNRLEGVISDHPESGVYQRGGYLVEISTIPKDADVDGVERKKGTHVIAPVASARLRELGSYYATWKKWDSRIDGLKPIDCPRELADTLAARNSWNLPVLVAMLGAPTMCPNGSIVDKPGYDKNTGVFINGAEWKKKTKKRPKQEDAVKARELLEDLVSEFPFVDEAARSSWVAALLTSLVRWSLRTAPFFAFDAPVMGSGKTLLASLIGILANGDEPAVMNYPNDESELRKSLLGVLQAGDPILLIDNIEYSISSVVLCSVATSDSYKDRMLGANKVISVSTAVTVLMNGNNMTVRGDLSTRVLLSRLDPGVENPEQRTFKRSDIRQYARRHREELINAALTILQAYVLAKKPDMGLPPYGRFEEWSDSVRSALVWAGGADPCETRARVETSDPEREGLSNLLEAWWAVYGDEKVLVRTIVSDVINGQNEQNEALREAVMAVAGDKNKVNQRKLGNKVSKWEGRVSNGMRLIRDGKFRGAVAWRIESSRVSGDSYDTYDSSIDRNTENCQKKTVNMTVSRNGDELTNKTNTTITPIQKACQGLQITPEQFKSKLSADDLADIANGALDSEALRNWAIEFNKDIYGGNDSE